MDKIIKSVYNLDLTGNDVAYLTRSKSKVVLYDTLTPDDNIIDIIGPTNQVLLLFPTTNNGPDGHWLSLRYIPDKKLISHFDSYGLSVSAEIQYSKNLNVQKNILGYLYNKAQQQGYRYEYNPYRFQVMATGVNVCGRWASIRNRFWYLDVEQFKRLFIGQTNSPDYLITIMTFLSLNENESDEQSLVKQLS